VRRAVVDASVAVKWAVPEDHSEHALLLLTEGFDLFAPAHWLAEVATTLWAKTRLRGVLTREKAAERVEWFRDLGIEETPIHDLIARAMALSFDLDLTVYDTLYLALAERLDAPLVSADRKLIERARGDPSLARLSLSLGNLEQTYRDTSSRTERD